MTTAPKPFVFVLMPFSKEFDDTYELAIQPACEAAGAYAERVDKQIFTGSILDRVYNQISKADLIVADMSERNPNVFYEVGYAHALGKSTILVTRTVDDIPFDLKHYPHIIYNTRLIDLKKDLESRINWHIENPEKRSHQKSSNLLIRVNGFSLGESTVVPVEIERGKVGFPLKVEIQNKIGKSIEIAEFQVGFLCSKDFCSAIIAEGLNNIPIEIDHEKKLFLHSFFFSILPESWCSISFRPFTPDREILAEESHEFSIRIYRESGFHDFPFTVKTQMSG